MASIEERFRRNLMVANFELVNTELVALINGLPNFRRNVQNWQVHRRRTIVAIQDIARTLDNIHYYANIGRGAGQSASILGALANLTAIILDLTGYAKSEDLRKAGDTLEKIGSITCTAVPFIESGISKSKIRKVQELLKEDERLFQEIAAWLKHSEDLDTALKNIFKVGFLPTLEMSVENMRLMSEVFSLYQRGSVVYADIVTGLNSTFPDISSINLRRFTNRHLPKVLDALNDVFGDQELRACFNRMPLGQLTSMIETTSTTLRLASWLSNDESTTDITSRIMSTLNLPEENRSLCSGIVTGLAQCGMIVVKALTLQSTLKELGNGATTKYSDALRILKDELSTELSQISAALPDDFYNRERSS